MGDRRKIFAGIRIKTIAWERAGSRLPAPSHNRPGCGSGARCGAPPTQPSPPGAGRVIERVCVGFGFTTRPNVIRQRYR